MLARSYIIVFLLLTIHLITMNNDQLKEGRVFHQEIVEILHGLFLLNAESESLKTKINDRMNHCESIIKESHSNVSTMELLDRLIKEVGEAYQSLQAMKQEIQVFQDNIIDLVGDDIDMYHKSQSQCNELCDRVKKNTDILQEKSLTLFEMIHSYMDKECVEDQDVKQLIITTIHDMFNHLSDDIMHDNRYGIDSNSRLCHIRNEQQERCCLQIQNLIKNTTQKWNEQLSAQNNLSDIVQAINLLMNQWNIEANQLLHKENNLNLIAQLVKQEILLQNINNAIVLFTQQYANQSESMICGYELHLKKMLITIEKELKELLSLNGSQITAKTNACSHMICMQIYDMQSSLIQYLNNLKSLIIMNALDQSMQSNLFKDTLTSLSNQLQNQVQEIHAMITWKSIEIESQLRTINAQEISTIAQATSNIKTALQAVNLDEVDAIVQATQAISAQASSTLSNFEKDIAIEYNKLCSKRAVIDLSIKNDAAYGILKAKEHIAESAQNTNALLAEQSTNIIGNILESTSYAFTDLTLQHDALRSKLAVVQNDITGIAKKIDRHTCDMTCQHAEICKKISNTEKRSVQEIATTNVNVSNIGFQVAVAIAEFAEQMGALLEGRTSVLNGLVSAINLITKKFIEPPII